MHAVPSAVENLPAHEVHVEAPVILAYLPASHSVHVVIPSVEYLLMGHATHVSMSPVPFAYLPAAQLVQPPAPAPAYFPGTQLVQTPVHETTFQLKANPPPMYELSALSCTCKPPVLEV